VAYKVLMRSSPNHGFFQVRRGNATISNRSRNALVGHAFRRFMVGGLTEGRGEELMGDRL
jgi:hypothetical protein